MQGLDIRYLLYVFVISSMVLTTIYADSSFYTFFSLGLTGIGPGKAPDNKPLVHIEREIDGHGCLTSQNMSWDPDLELCVNIQLSLSSSDRELAKIALMNLSDHRELILASSKSSGRGNIHRVLFYRDGDWIEVLLKDSIIYSISLTKAECEAKGGRVLDMLFEKECGVGEDSLGVVVGIIKRVPCCARLTGDEDIFNLKN
ncbi:hypothetical protein ACFLRF_01685 [Candidatus Altiarchaeota archaeon]